MPAEPRPDQRPETEPVDAPGPPHPAPGRPMAREASEPGSVDPHRPIEEGQPGSGAAPGGEPVMAPGTAGDDEAVSPPGTEEGGAPEGPPAAHEQPPR